jgi:preprotein translocase subunit SecD
MYVYKINDKKTNKRKMEDVESNLESLVNKAKNKRNKIKEKKDVVEI